MAATPEHPDTSHAAGDASTPGAAPDPAPRASPRGEPPGTGAGQSGTARDGESTRPDRSRSDRSQPDRAQPDRSRSDRTQPDRSRSDRSRAEHGRPEHGRPARGRTDGAARESGRDSRDSEVTAEQHWETLPLETRRSNPPGSQRAPARPPRQRTDDHSRSGAVIAGSERPTQQRAAEDRPAGVVPTDERPAPERSGRKRPAPGRPGPSGSGTADQDRPAGGRDSAAAGRENRPAGPPGARRRAPVLLAATVTTVWAAVLSFVPVAAIAMLGELIDGSAGPSGQLVRFSLAAWLLAHGVPVDTGLGRVGLVPLTLTALVVWRVLRAGVHTTRAIGGRRSRSARLTGLAAVSVGSVYTLLGAAAAGVAAGDELGVPLARSALTLGAIGLLAGLAGAAQEAGLLGALFERLPRPVCDGVRTGLVATLLILGAGAGVAGMSLALSAGDASDVVGAYRSGVAGQAGLTLICLMFAPNAIVWAASYLLGPGFAIGVGTTISAGEVRLGPLPAVPLLAALPENGASRLAGLLLALPLAAGMTAGWLLTRRRLRLGETVPGSRGWLGLLGAAALAGPVAGVLLAVAALAARGPLGSGRLADIGPDAWPLAGIACLVVALGAAVAAAATRVLMEVRGGLRARNR